MNFFLEQTETESERNATVSEYELPPASQNKKRFLTPKLAMVLDSCKISDRDAMRIVAATAEALGFELKDLALSRQTLKRYRSQKRKEIAENINESFKNLKTDNITIH